MFNVATAGSLLLCVATAGVWARAQSRADVAGWAGWEDNAARRLWRTWGVTSRGDAATFQISTGTLQFDDATNIHIQPNLATAMQPHFFHFVHPVFPPFNNAAWCKVFSSGAKPLGFEMTLVSVPFWLIAAVFAIIPLLRGSAYCINRWMNRCRARGFDVVGARVHAPADGSA